MRECAKSRGATLGRTRLTLCHALCASIPRQRLPLGPVVLAWHCERLGQLCAQLGRKRREADRIRIGTQHLRCRGAREAHVHPIV
eukprot:3348431-Prymnesium_polylepis.1